MHVKVVSTGLLDTTIRKLRTLLSATEQIHDNHYTEHYTEKNKDISEPPKATETLLAKDVTVTRFPEIGMLLLLSDGEYERHSSIGAERFVEEIPLTVLDEVTLRQWPASETAACAQEIVDADHWETHPDHSHTLSDV